MLLLIITLQEKQYLSRHAEQKYRKQLVIYIYDI